MTTAIRTRARNGKSGRWRDRYGPWAVVTGASDGIGKELATQLAEAGLHLVLVARRGDILEALAADCRDRFGVETAVVGADLASAAGVQAVIDAVRERDVGLFAAAAGFGTSGAFADIARDEELGMIDVNCRAVVALTHHFANAFRTRGSGGIVLLSSLVAFQGVPRASTYAATKAFIQNFAEGLRIELRGHGVDVLASAPGPVWSGFNARANMRSGMGVSAAVVARETIAALGRRGTVRPGLLSRFLELSLKPLPRWGRTRMMAIVMAGMTRHQHDPAPVGAPPQVG